MQSGGPFWDVPKGRKDGRTSKASETRQLPAPTFNISQLQQSFSQRGLSLEDLVALSGHFTQDYIINITYIHFTIDQCILTCRSRIYLSYILANN